MLLSYATRCTNGLASLITQQNTVLPTTTTVVLLHINRSHCSTVLPLPWLNNNIVASPLTPYLRRRETRKCIIFVSSPLRDASFREPSLSGKLQLCQAITVGAFTLRTVISLFISTRRVVVGVLFFSARERAQKVRSSVVRRVSYRSVPQILPGL